jgi:hypothetical protein
MTSERLGSWITLLICHGFMLSHDEANSARWAFSTLDMPLALSGCSHERSHVLFLKVNWTTYPVSREEVDSNHRSEAYEASEITTSLSRKFQRMDSNHRSVGYEPTEITTSPLWGLFIIIDDSEYFWFTIFQIFSSFVFLAVCLSEVGESYDI